MAVIVKLIYKQIFSIWSDGFMGSTGKKVRIKIQSSIDHAGEEETSILYQEGHLFNKGKFDVLVYEEVDEDGEKTKNFITIQPDQVLIKRSGAITMNQRFIKDQMTEGVYQHAYGNFHMETTTHTIDQQPLLENDTGHVRIDYTVLMNGNLKRKHVLKVIYRQEVYK